MIDFYNDALYIFHLSGIESFFIFLVTMTLEL